MFKKSKKILIALLFIWAMPAYTMQIAAQKRKNREVNPTDSLNFVTNCTDIKRIIISYAFFNTWNLRNRWYVNSDVKALTFLPEKNLLAAGLQNGTIEIWEPLTEMQVSTLANKAKKSYEVTALINLDRDHIVSGDLSGHLKVWQIDQAGLPKSVQEIPNLPGGIESIAYSKTSAQLAVANGFDDTISLYNSSDVNKITPLRTIKYDLVSSLAYSPDGKYLAAGSTVGTGKIFDTQTGKSLGEFGTYGHVNGISWLPDKETVLSSHENGNVFKTDLSLNPSASTPLEASVNDIYQTAHVYAPVTKQLIIGNGEPHIKIWDAQTGKLINTLNGHEDRVLSLAISPDGQYLASGSCDQSIIIWENLGVQLIQLLNLNAQNKNPKKLRLG